MQSNTIQQQTKPSAIAGGDPFDLDISVLEVDDSAAALINLTDDGCGSTCSSPCATAVA